MGSAIFLPPDFDGAGLRRLDRQTRDADRLGRVMVQIARDRVVRSHERGPDGLINDKTRNAMSGVPR